MDGRDAQVVVSIPCPDCKAASGSCPRCGGDNTLLLSVRPEDATLPADELVAHYGLPDGRDSA